MGYEPGQHALEQLWVGLPHERSLCSFLPCLVLVLSWQVRFLTKIYHPNIDKVWSLPFPQSFSLCLSPPNLTSLQLVLQLYRWTFLYLFGSIAFGSSYCFFVFACILNVIKNSSQFCQSTSSTTGSVRFLCMQLGRICLDILKDKWSPALQIRTVLLRFAFRFWWFWSLCLFVDFGNFHI